MTFVFKGVEYMVKKDHSSLNGEDGLRHWLDLFTGSMFTGLSEKTKQSILKKVETNVKDILFQEGEWVLIIKGFV